MLYSEEKMCQLEAICCKFYANRLTQQKWVWFETVQSFQKFWAPLSHPNTKSNEAMLCVPVNSC